MSVASALAAIRLTDDMTGRGWRQGLDVAHFLRSAMTKAGEAVRLLELVQSTMPANDENQIALQAEIEALR
jgi:hypothetical protein